MATAYTSLLGFALPVTGELAGTWGTVVNDNITELVEDAIAATATASVASGDWTLTTTGSGAANEARCAILIPTGSPGVSRNIIAPSQSKAYVVINQSDAAVVVKGSATTGTTIAAGDKAIVAWNGSDFVTIASAATDGVSTISFGTTGLTPSTATSGAVSVAGTLVASNGGTGQSSYTTGDILYASSSTALAKLADVATGNALISGGVGVAPSWGKVGLTTHVNGTLAVGNGGTGATTLTANNVILGNGTSAVQFVAPGANGNVLTSNGTTWTSAAAAATLFGQTDSASPFETSLGYQAGNVVTGVNNTFVGYQAGLVATTGLDNTAVGFKALDALTTGNRNTAVGSNALGAATSALNNSAFGNSTLEANTTGRDNTAVGQGAMAANTTGSYNTAVGADALDSNTGGTNNVAIGYQALTVNTTGGNNTAVGYSSLSFNSTGIENTAVGTNALNENTANYNTAVGAYSLRYNTTGTYNVAVGNEALNANTTGSYNIAIGFALTSSTTGSNNVAIGYNALTSNSVSNNTGVGYYALQVNTTGTGNTAIGYQAGDTITTGSNNTVIGNGADASSATVSNEVTIGNSSVTSFRIPGLSVTWGANTVPFRNIPAVGTKTGSYTLAVADVGKYVQVGSGGSITIPDATFAEGDVVSIFNNTTGNITITCTITTAYIAGTDSDKASVTLATRGVATILFISSTVCVISGNVT